MLSNFEFSNPEFFWLFLILPVAIAWYIWKYNKNTPAVKISSIKGFKTTGSWLPKLRPLLFLLRICALALIIIALARPRNVEVSRRCIC